MLEISWRPLRSNTILLEILLTKECGMLTIFLKHFAWALNVLNSAMLSHVVCKQYNNSESTQVSKIRTSAFGRTAWFQTLHNVSNLVAPRRLLSSGLILALSHTKFSQIKQQLLPHHIMSIAFFDACFTSHWKHFQFVPVHLQPIPTPSLFDALHVNLSLFIVDCRDHCVISIHQF